MKEWAKRSAVLLLVILIGAGSALGVLVQRAGIEKGAKTYDLVVDYSDYREMANQSEMDIAEWLSLLAENGVDKVGLYETNADALADEPGVDVSVRLERDITAESDWKEIYPPALVDKIEASKNYTDALITVRDEGSFRWITDAFERRAEGIKMETFSENGIFYIWIYGNGGGLSGEEWVKFPLGLWPAQVEMVKNAGCSIVPRTTAKDGQNGMKFAEDVLREFREYEAPYFMNSGDGILGFDDLEKGPALLEEYLKDTGAAFVVTEQMNEQGNVTWPGDKAFLSRIDHQAVRAFNEWSYIQCRYKYYNYDGPQEIANSLYRAIYERNCTVVYFKAILAKKMKTTETVGTYVTDPDEYVRLIDDLNAHMEKCGYAFRTSVATPSYKPPLIMKILMSAGCAAAAVILLDLFFMLGDKVRYGLLILITAGAAGAFAVMPDTAKILLSIGGGAVMPCVAAAGMVRWMRYSDGMSGRKMSSPAVIARALAGTLIIAAVCFISSMFTSAALSESEYILEISLYRGVKLMQLIPLMIFCISFVQVYILEQYAYGWEIARPGAGDDRAVIRLRRERWNTFLDRPVRFREVFWLFVLCAVFGMVGLIGIYYIIRTGNMTDDVISSTELIFRNYLDNSLPARPRIKEFMIGYPCMMLMIWSFRRKLPAVPFFFGCGAVIGMTSIVNTFLHIRTPLTLGITRVLIGLSFGLIIGLAAVVFFEICYRLIRARIDKGRNEEA